MITIDATLRRALEESGRDLILTLDPALQGLPETAHGGSVLAVFDARAGAPVPRQVSGPYHRHVPLGVPLTLQRARADSAHTFALSDPSSKNVLVEGRVVPGANAAPTPDAPAHGAGPASWLPLPVSRTCFACGTDNDLGLRARLGFDDDTVGGTWEPLLPFPRGRRSPR